VKFIRSTVPIPILFASIGVPIFALFDLLTRRLLSQFINGTGNAALASAFLGGLMGYSIGWFVVKKCGLSRSATAYDVDAAVNKKSQNAQRP
jgi:hypothetical protein